LEAWLEGNRLGVSKGLARMGDSSVEWSGALEDFRQPRITSTYKAAVLLRDIETSPIREGFATSAGEITYSHEGGLRIAGDVQAQQVGFAAEAIRLRDVSARSQFVLTPEKLELTGLHVKSPYAEWQGRGRLEEWRKFSLEGEAAAVELSRVQALLLNRPYPWNATLSGPLAFSGELVGGGLQNGRVETVAKVEPAEGEMNLSGELSLVWSQACGCIDFASSHLATESSRANFHGVLGQRLEVGFFATRMRDLEPVIAKLLRQDNYRLPFILSQGIARMNAVVTGPLDAPEIRGHMILSNALVEEVLFTGGEADFLVTPSRLELTDVVARRDTARVSGRMRLDLDHWEAGLSSGIEAKVHWERCDVQNLLRLLKSGFAAQGKVEASLDVAGSLGAPWGSAQVVLDDGVIGGERLKRLSADLSLTSAGALRASLQHEQSRVALTGSWQHPAGDYRNGTLKAKAVLSGFQLQDWETLRPASPRVEAILNGEVEGQLAVVEGRAEVRSLDGFVEAPALLVGNSKLGRLRVNGGTKGGTLALNGTLSLPQGQVEAQGRVELKGDYVSDGTIRLPRVSFTLIKGLMSEASEAGTEPWPVRGFVNGEVVWRGPLSEPKKMTAVATIRQLQVRPRQQQPAETQVDTSELTLRNSAPVVIEMESSAIRVRSAQFSALNTELALSGHYAVGARSPWNLDMKGTANLAVLGSFYKELLASGAAQISASLRGPAGDPQMSGKMLIRDGSFFLKDVASGIEKAEGTVYFEKNRANIEKLAGVTGGGKFQLSGFVGLTGGELSYRLQALANDVRVRYPEGVSTTLDADMTLTGSTARSLLAGTITVEKSGFLMSGDVASLVGNSGNPIPAAAMQGEFLRNLQFDVRVRTAPDAVLVSSYTSDLETEADLRLRGSPAKPVLLGGIKANQGQVNFFGNRYTISRGEVLFYNTAVVQPQIDLDLETRVRGITVYLNVNGPLSRLNVTYRSEPPLQSSEILALLTVGRAPASTTSSVATSDSIRNQTVMENSTASNTLLGTALSAGLNSRTERFFGSSRIRIDPSATGVDNLPQARLSIEQSISRDITLTYITNLNRSTQQVVQLEWDVSQQWSVIANKDENGAFTIDFLFRRRFK
jgi:translocation and assembly module TamB